MDNQVKTTLFKFGDFYLNTFERTLVKDNKSIPIPSKTFDVLHLLVKRNGKTITKDTIMNEVWNGSFVEEGNLSVHISKLRKLLEATKDEPFIKTVSGHGYQFVVNVEAVSKRPDKAKAAPGSRRSTAISDDEFRPDSIAVLPLKNENGDEEIDYLADGLTESLINCLSYIPDFRVLARDTVFRYKDKDINPVEIGKTLGVASVLTGRIRIFKENLIIGVELVNTSDGIQIWGTHLNEPFADIFIMQEKLAEAIAENLKENAFHTIKNALPGKSMQGTESYRLYLKGKYLLDKHLYENFDSSAKYFRESIQLDPRNALAHIALAECYLWQYAYDCKPLSESLNIVLKSLDAAALINPNISSLYSIKGKAALNLEWDMQKSELFFKKAIKLNPNNIAAYHGYARLSIVTGNFPYAIKLSQKFESLAPLSSLNNKWAAQILYNLGDFESAATKLEEILAFEPNDPMTLTLLSAVFAEMGKFDSALEASEASFKIGHHYENIAMIGYIDGLAGHYDDAMKIIEKLEIASKNTFIPQLYRALIYTGLGKPDAAFGFLEQSFKNHESDIIALKIDPRFFIHRNDARFNDLISRIGLPTD